MRGEQIAKVLVDPERITITGPRQHVEMVDAATTDPVDASGTSTQATFVTNVYVADPLVQVVQPTPVQVTVIMEKSNRGERALSAGLEDLLHPLRGSHLSSIILCGRFQIRHPTLLMNPQNL